ncbi:MAG: glycolate oxidase iron-sulfur subunit [Gammaproteobacteria bacterium]|nr:MAG: glycolate oxidase iron-sulfur subunit [Gammaproteobacteria bacterium]
MQTSIPDTLANDTRVRIAESILRKCVHCGFCLATCPTYQLTGDELDSPRGRIYLIKQVAEGQLPTRTTQAHLDRCLSCRSCETTCPSGVEYGQLIDQGRALVNERVPRPAGERLMRKALLTVLPHPARIGTLTRLGQSLRLLMPTALKAKLPPRRTPGEWPVTATETRSMLVLDGCAQRSMTPATNHAAARVLAALGIRLQPVPEARCCGAVSHHLDATDEARQFMRENIDAWWPAIEVGAEAILVTASGCGMMVKEYGRELADDPDYADRARRVSELARDTVEVLQAEDLTPLRALDGFDAAVKAVGKVAFHPPCTLQHGQKLPLATEGLLGDLGFRLTPVPDAHLCCGSAGTYSILQPVLARQLLARKTAALISGEPDVVATANIGCQMHLEGGLGKPVVHWIELLDRALSDCHRA